MMKFQLHKLAIEHDRNYGCEHRTGWSIVWNGHYLVQLEPWLIVAIWKAIRNK